MNLIAQGIAAVREECQEVACYRVSGDRRAVYAQAVDGGQLLIDVPVEGTEGQLFTVDPCWRNEWTLDSFLANYVEVGEQLGWCPISPDLEGDIWGEFAPPEALSELYWRIGRS